MRTRSKDVREYASPSAAFEYAAKQKAKPGVFAVSVGKIENGVCRVVVHREAASAD